MIAKQYAQALASYQAAQQLPVTLQEASGNTSSRKGEISYWIGNAYEAMGDAAKARSSWSDASNPSAEPAAGGRDQRPGRGSVGGLAAGGHIDQAALYYQALALQKLGQADRAKALFAQLVDAGNKALAKDAAILAVATPSQRAKVADAHYLAGLGQLGLNNRKQAQHEFSLALEASPDHYAAMRALTEMKP